MVLVPSVCLTNLMNSFAIKAKYFVLYNLDPIVIFFHKVCLAFHHEENVFFVYFIDSWFSFCMVFLLYSYHAYSIQECNEQFILKTLKLPNNAEVSPRYPFGTQKSMQSSRIFGNQFIIRKSNVGSLRKEICSNFVMIMVLLLNTLFQHNIYTGCL